jgi:hypothetical protein
MRGRDDWAIGTLSLGVLASVLLVVWLTPTTGFRVPEDLAPELAALYGHYDSTGQRRAHGVALLLVALLCAVAPALRRALARVSDDTRRGAHALIGVCTAGLVAAAVADGVTSGGSGLLLATALGALTLLWLGRSRRSDRAGAQAFAAVITVALILLLGLGFVTQLDLSLLSDSELAHFDLHYAIVMATGPRIALGEPIFTEVTSPYGIVMPFLSAVAERIGGPLDMGDYVLGIRACQTAFVLGFLWLYRHQSRGGWLAALLAICLVLPGYQFVSNGTVLPNHSAWRSMPLLLGPLAMVLCRDLGQRARCVCLGAACALAVLFNLESGLAAGAGMFVYLWLRAGWGGRLPVREWGAAALALGLGAGVGTAAMLGAWRGFLGYWPAMFDPNGFFLALTASSAGISGLRWSFDPIAIVVFGVALFVLLGAMWRADLPATHRRALRGGVAAILLVWFAYYAHRPHPTKMHSYLALFGLLAVDLLPVLLRGWRGRDGVRFAALGVTATACLVFLPRVVMQYVAIIPLWATLSTQPFGGSLTPDAAELSGVWLGSRAEQVIRARARFLEHEAPRGEIWFATAQPYLTLLLTRVAPATPALHGFAEVRTRQDYQALLELARESSAQRLLLDDPDVGLAGSSHEQAFYQRLRSELPELGWQLRQRESGWMVYARDRRE